MFVFLISPGPVYKGTSQRLTIILNYYLHLFIFRCHINSLAVFTLSWVGTMTGGVIFFSVLKVCLPIRDSFRGTYSSAGFSYL